MKLQNGIKGKFEDNKSTIVHLKKLLFGKFRIRYFFPILVFSLFTACEYEINIVYEREVNENVSPPEINVVELNLEHDTIFCYTQKDIRFRFVSSRQDIQAVRFTVDNEQKYIEESDHGIFNLDSYEFAGGNHSLTMEVYTTTGSGSIAEKMGMESFLFSRSWIVVIDRNYYSSIKSTIIDGLLKLSWDRYRDYDFIEYVIYREGFNTKKEIARVKSDYFIDSSYVGEQTRYYVEVSHGNSQKMPWVNLDMKKDLPQLRLDVSKANEYVLRWDKAKYYGAADTFNLFIRTGLQYSRIKTTIDPEDTSHQLNYPFGSSLDLTLRIVPENNLFYNEGSFSSYETQQNVSLGYPFAKKFNFAELSQVGSNEFVYLSGYDSLIRYSVSEPGIVERYSYQLSGCTNFSNLSFSASGKYITSYVNCTDDILLVSSHDFSERHINNLKFLTGSLYAPPVPVSDNGIIIANNVFGGFCLYDFIKGSTLFSYNKTGNAVKGLSISMNGNNIFLLDDSLRLVHYGNSRFTNVWSHSRLIEPKFYEFDGANPDRMVLWDGLTFFSKSCSDFSTINEFTLTDELILDIDYYNNRILTYSTGYLKIRSLMDGALYKTVGYSLNPGFWYNNCYLTGNAVVSMQGVIYFID